MNNSGIEMIIEEGEFKGHKILTIKEGKRILFSAGVRKCNIILKNLEAIKGFLAKNSESKEARPKNPLSEFQGNDIISNGI